MAAYNDRVPLKDGTVLHTTDGKCFHILHSTAVGGSAILYSAHLDGSSLDVTLKEFYPAGCVRVAGVALGPGLAAPDVSPALRQAFYQRLERMAQHELELSQLAYNGSFHALPHLEQLKVCSISQPEEPMHRSADGTALPCTFLYLPTLNPSKGFFLSDLLAECAAYPRDEEHPFGALMPDEPRSIAAPHILTTLHLIRLILDALATLHKTAIHGDISLGNLFIDGDLHTGTLRGAVFLDFGSARLLDAPNGKTAPILPSEKLYTTPLFCAPEIFTGARSGEPFCLTPAADVYSVGVLLRLLLRKEALAAYRKFPEDLAEELKPAEIYPSDTVPSARPVLPQLNRILTAAAEPDPEKRIPVAEMLKEINGLIEQLSAPRFPLAENLSSPETFIPHSRDNELKAIRKQMDSGVRPIFLYGLGGLGKTETARALLRQCKKDGMRVAFFNYEQSVRDTILNLEFANYKYTPSKPSLTLEQQEEEHYHENLKLLAAMGSDSVVVMDNFDSNSRTFDDLRSEPAYQDLIALGGPHLIITTRFTPKGNPPVEIKPLPKELLLKMMLNIMDEKDNSPSVDTLLNIIEAVQGHTLTCYLIGNALSDLLGDLTAQDILDALNQYNLHSLTEDVTSDKDRKYTTETLYGHLKILFDMCGMTDTYRAALCHTLLLPQKGLDVKLFRQGESKEEQNALKSLIAHGWVQCTCSTENIHLLTIHPLIRELILNEMKPQEEDVLPYSNRLWERYDPRDFTKEDLQLRIDLLESALKFLYSGPEQAELHYRLGILWLVLGDCLPPCKDDLILDIRISSDIYFLVFDSLDDLFFNGLFNGYNHLSKSALWAQSNTSSLKNHPRYECYLSGEALSALTLEAWGLSNPWKNILNSLRLINRSRKKNILNFLCLINRSSNQIHDEKSTSIYHDIVFCLAEIQTLIAQEQDRSRQRKVLYNNLACVCKIAFDQLSQFSTHEYTENEISETKRALKTADSLMDKLLKMAEVGSTELQIAVLENRGSWYSIKKDEPTARKYYKEAFTLAKSYAKRIDIPWLSCIHCRMGKSWRNQYDQTGDIKYLEIAIAAYHRTNQQWPKYVYNETIALCMIQRARKIYTQNPMLGQFEAKKILDFWEPIVQNVKKSSGIDIYFGACRMAADICCAIPVVAEDESQRMEQFVTHEKHAISFLEEGLDRLKEFPAESFQRKYQEMRVYNNIRIMLDGLFALTQDKHDEEKKFYYWKKYIDAAERAFGSAKKQEVIAFATALEKAGYLEDAAFYHKKAEKFNQEN